jgi:hypothetical protein
MDTFRTHVSQACFTPGHTNVQHILSLEFLDSNLHLNKAWLA